MRTVPIPTWVKTAVDEWTTTAGITNGVVFRAINKAGRVWGDGMCAQRARDVVRAAAARANIDKLAPHDLRRTCARLCHLAGGELDQIQFLLGHVSIQTTERDLGCKQKLRGAINDRLESISRMPPCDPLDGGGRVGTSALDDFRLGILPTERLAWRGVAASMRLAASARSKPPPSIPPVIATPPSSRGPYAALSRLPGGALVARFVAAIHPGALSTTS